MTNDAILAILALPDIPERQLRFLLALGTFTRGKGGWRKAGIRLLASKARLSPTTAAKARAELVKAGTIEFVRGKAGQLSIYRIRLPGITDHLDAESTNNAGTPPDTNNAGTPPDTNNAGTHPSTNPPPARVPTGPISSTRPNAPASANANEGSNTYGSQSSGPNPVRTNDPAGPLGKPGADRRGSAAAGRSGGTGQIDDDDDSETSGAALAPDPRTILRGLLGDLADDKIDFIITRIEGRPNIPDPARYLLDQIGRDNGERFTEWARKLGTPDLDGHAEGAWSRQGDDDDFLDYETRPRRSPGLGQCTACGWWFVVASEGRINRHKGTRSDGSYGTCPGAGQPPVRPVRCTGCGRTGLALASLTGLCSACTRERKQAQAAEGSP